jgi:signal transduction histidine kinase
MAPFQEWFANSLLLLPLNVSDELVGLLLCCDAERLQEDQEEGLHFVQAAVGMLSAMLRIDQIMNALEKRVAEQTEELAAFFNMAVLASGSEHMTETLAAALTMIREIGNCDAVCVHILSPDGASLQLAYQVGLDHVDHRHILRLPRDSVLYQRIQRTSTPILVTELNPTRLEAHVDEFQTYLGAPMVVRSNVQGLVSCYWRFVHSVSLNQMSLLTALTDQLGIILENQRLHRHAQEAGVVHERQRLARELHDSVTQTMYGVMIFARAGREALEDNDFERLSDCLAQVEGASLRSLKEMRLLLYQLRPLALESHGVVEAIRSRLELVEHRLGVEVDMQLSSIIGLSHEVEEVLYHIAMEALNNILKHADADRVAIQLMLVGDHAELRVSDDGVGFKLEEVNQGMGLNNMRDRIDSVGGDLQIHTQVDAGTSIVVRIPIA